MKHYNKTYRATNYDQLHIVFEMDGALKHVFFGGVNRYQMIRGHYETNDEKIQETLEKNPMFGREIGRAHV